MRLVIAPRPEPTESLMGYVLRLTELNGYSTTAYVLSSMVREWYQSTLGRLDASRLGPLTGLDQADVDRLTCQPSNRPRAFVRVYGNDLPVYEVNLKRTKICPPCLAEGRPCEAFWDLSQASVCPVHHVHLVSQCPGCSKQLLWSRSKVRQCKCGFDLSTAAVAPASPALTNLMASMRNHLYRDESLSPSPLAMGHLAHLDLRRFCKMIWVMSGLVHQTQGGRLAPKARRHYKGQLETVSEALANWPLGFRSFLEDTYLKVIQDSEELPQFRTMFSWLLVRLKKNDEEGGAAFEFLEREIYLFGAQHWTRDAMAREASAQSIMPKRMRWGTLSEASEFTGLHLETLKKWIATGEVKSRRIKNNSTRGIIVDMDSIRGKQLTKYPAVSIRDAAPVVGVSIETLKELRASGAFEENWCSIFPGSFTKEDVDAFAGRFEKLRSGKRVTGRPGVTTLDAAFIAWTASPKEKAGLLALLLDDAALVVGKVRGRGVGCLQVLLDTVTAYFHGVRAKKEECLSLLKTAERLGCNAAVVTYLKRGGHIKTQKMHGRDTPILASVIEFDRKYEAISITSKRMGVNAKSAYARLDFGKLHHISVRTTQYSTIFVHRKNLPKIEKMLIALK